MRLYGIDEETWGRLQSLMAQFPHIERAVLFGSRAKGTNNPFSDVDITLMGKEVSLDDVLGLQTRVEDLLLPYEFDFCVYDHLQSPELRSHIDRCGVEVYPMLNREVACGCR